MEPDFLERVFERFSQADRSMDRSRGGLGLGLALVSGLVEMHGGEVKAYSNGLGRGCEFRIRLPLAKEGAPPAPTPSSTEPMKSYRILLIDDRRDAILPLKKMLILLGQKIAVAMDGKTGMETAREFQPEIVLCDIGLPDMDGYAVAQAIRADPKLRSVYLVAVTGYGQEDDRRRAVQSGFDYHLTKPVGKDQLEMLLRKMPRFRVSFDVNDETSE
jgi:CheY-like chemotaxis protein